MGEEREITVRIGERDYRIASDDEYLTYIAGGFEPEMVRLFGRLLRPGDRVLDIGANIGCTALLFGEIAQSVDAFEPSPGTFRYLARNVQQAPRGNIRVHNFGLGSARATTTLTMAPSNRSGGFVSDRTQAGDGFTTETIHIRRLDAVMNELALLSVDFVKVDVEGFEGHVLKGAERTLARHRPVVVTELNHWCLNAFQRTSIPDFFDQLRALFPILYAVDGSSYLDLHDVTERYQAMYHHITRMRFPNVVGGFDEERFSPFRAALRQGFHG